VACPTSWSRIARCLQNPTQHDFDEFMAAVSVCPTHSQGFTPRLHSLMLFQRGSCIYALPGHPPWLLSTFVSMIGSCERRIRRPTWD
jgi:hypothetical protein